MGGAKRLLEQQDAQGWSFTDSYVCAGCVDEDVLEAAVSAASTGDTSCDFCGSLGAAPLDALLEVFVPGVRRAYARAVDELPYDGSEGGYQGPVLETREVVNDFWALLTGDGLTEAVAEAMDDELWVEKDWAWMSADEALAKSWDEFCRQVKFETRYVIWRLPEDETYIEPREIPPAQILDTVGHLVDAYPENLTGEIEPGTLLWRARPHNVPAGFDMTPAELGTTPVQKSQVNRMSPAGIPMFYGALDENTAILEATQGSKKTHVTVAGWRTSRLVKLLDLTNLRPIPSLFADDGDERPQWQFLHYFASSLRAKAEVSEVDYVPTQIVTEYFLKVFGQPGGFFDGIQYWSDVEGGQVCVVLDVRNEACVETSTTTVPADGLRLHLDFGTLDTVSIA